MMTNGTDSPPLPKEQESHVVEKNLHNMGRNPFVKKFRTEQSNYIYDVNSNEIIRVNDIIYEIIDYVGERDASWLAEEFKDRFGTEEIIGATNSITEAMDKHGLLSCHRPEIFSGISSVEDIEYMLSGNLSQLILEVTRSCNNRCAYCSVSGKYSPGNETSPHKEISQPARPQDQESMSFETARKAVDFFIEQSSQESGMRPAITFHGGEPILRFDLIKKVIEYVKRKGTADKYSFSLTTNGTLLSREVIDYFADNNVSILVSLDGPEAMHDRYRCFPNGDGTFASIMSTLERIRHSHPDYFKNNISFNAVLPPPYTFDDLIGFFYHTDLLAPLKDKLSVGTVDTSDTTFIQDFDLEAALENYSKEMEQLRSRHKDALINGTYADLTIEKRWFLEEFHVIVCRPMEKLDGCFPPMGACFPGQRRLFVPTSGDFYMC
ncbi:MAG: radical SAM protein, partial [bacterium]|nr:radical SAM protein [bacterium]